jgi:uncharacterized protein YbjT (DUF2867 family)
VSTALLAGATGLVGGHVLQQLLADPTWDRVIALVRRELKLKHPKLQQRITSFEEIAHVPWFPQSHDVFCCLGTTLNRAGSKEAFRRVDHDLGVDLARRASSAGADQFLVVSSFGAAPGAPSFYLRVKAEMEAAVSAVPFGGTHIFRPSFLAGGREESRPGERITLAALGAFSFALYGPLYRLRPVDPAVVARAMLRIARERPRGVRIFHSERIQEIGGA